MTSYPAKVLDAKGRCCGRKPLVYKREGGPHKFCPRCNAAFGLDTGCQIGNWAYDQTPSGDFVPRGPAVMGCWS